MKINLQRNAKKNRWFFIGVFILAMIIAIGIGTVFREQNAISIAVAGPMSGSDSFRGEDLLRGTQLYFDEVNKAGGVNGKKLKLLIFDDEGKPELAKEKAQEIVDKTQAIAVIGHFFSTTSIAAKDIYEAGGIAAITGTATADELTIGNKFYFRAIFNNSLQGTTIANYVKSVLQQEKVSIIYNDRNLFSASLITGFIDAFKGLEGEIKYQWNVNDFGQTREEQYQAITRDLLKNKNESPGTIMVALNGREAVSFIVALRRKGLNYPIIGGDSLAGDDIGQLFNYYPEEQAQPGYFSDGVLAAIPIIFDVADEKIQELKNTYWEKFQVWPSWNTVANYDAAQVLVAAIKRAKVEGNRKKVAEERLLVRDSLSSLNNPENAVEGLQRTFYFDEEGNAATNLSIGIFENQQFISAFTQFHPISDISIVDNLEKKLATGEVIIANNRYLQKTNVVYTGIDLNEIANLDQKTSSYTADFYLWFRYRGDIDPSNIEFINFSVERLDSGEKLELSEPIEKETVNGITYELYRMKADFKEQFLFDDYPFDRQKISIRFRHTNKQRENIIYVVDAVGLEDISSQGILNRLKDSEVFSTITNWEIESAQIFQDTIENRSTLGKEQLVNATDAGQEYSRFNFVVTIKRKFASFSLKNLLPLLFFILVSYLLLFLPFDDISVEAVSGVLLAVVFFHLSLLEALPEGVGYVVALDYVFYVIYGLIVLQMVMVAVGKKAIGEDQKHKIHKLLKLARLLYVLLLAIAIFAFGFYYKPIDFPEARDNRTINNSASASPGVARPGLFSGSDVADAEGQKSDRQITLKLGYLPADYQQQTNRILAAFNAKHPLITVKSIPANLTVNLNDENELDYQTFLGRLLKKDVATDLLLVEPFQGGKELFRNRYLQALGDGEKYRQTFSPEARKAWSTENGELYALPAIATVRGIYYNPDIFTRLGLEVPTTWEDLLYTAEVLEYYGYLPFANASEDEKTLMDEMFVNILHNFIGGVEGWPQYLRGDRCFNDDNVVAAFQALADLRSFLAPPQQASNYYESLSLFIDGKAGMWFASSASIPLLESYAPELNWSIFPTPAPAGKPEFFRFEPDFAVAINANSLYKEQAKQFIEWLSTPEAAELFARELPGLFPMQQASPHWSSSIAPTFLSLEQEKSMKVSWGGMQKLADGLPDGYSLMKNGVLGVLAGEITPAVAANTLQRGLAKWFEPAQICKK